MSRNNSRGELPSNMPVMDTEPPISAISAAPPQSPTFNWTVPTEIVQLPSRGLFYPAGHPLEGVTEIEMKYMTAKEEDILTSRSLLKQGIALDRVVQNLIINPSIKVSDMLVGDRNALVVAARATGYGTDYTTKVTCPSCGTVGDFTFDIEDPQQVEFEEAMARNFVERTTNNTLKIFLPMSEVVVECKLLNTTDELQIFKETERNTRKKLPEANSTGLFRNYIISVNGDNSPLSVISFINSMPAKDARFLRITYAEVVPNIDLSQIYSCDGCNYEADMEVPLTSDFFWPR